MATLLARLGRGAYRHRRLVVAIWLLVLAAIVAVIATVGPKFNDAFTIPGSESQRALDRLHEVAPTAAGAGAEIVFVAPQGHTVVEPTYATAVAAVVKAAAAAPQVATVTDPIRTKALSRDGRAALAQVEYTVPRDQLTDASVTALQRTVRPAEAAGMQVAAGGEAFTSNGVTIGAKEFVGVLVAVLVLVLTFGSLLAAGMNLLTALLGIAVGLGGLVAVSGAISLSSTAPTLALMIGLAVGIDYALFILSRHRSQLAGGMDPEESAARSTGTAGSAVVFAGLTVVIALAGLSVVGIPFLTVMGLGAAGTVLVAVLVALTLLPALVGFAGHRLAPEPGSRAARREAADAAEGIGRSAGARWARLVTRRPLVTVLLVVAGIVALAIPAPKLQLALPDNGAAAEGTTQRQAYDLISEHFGPGLNGPLVVLLDGLDPAGAQAAAQKAAVTLGGIPADAAATSFRGGVQGVAFARPQLLPGGRAALVSVVPTSGPQEQATSDLVHRLRDLAPRLQRQTGARDVAVTGQTAVAIDVSDKLAAALLPFAIVVVGLALILLLLVFRSILVPITAAVGFLLSVAASFGAVVAVFQWGWLSGVLGVPTTGPVISFLPVLLMAVLFGLAMDYEVFLVSRMREEYVHGAAPRDAVVGGARHGSRVVVAAALIMFSVFASFVTIEDVTVKAIAFGLAVGILVDAFLVRMTLVPAVMALLGRAAWALPRRLDRLLPDLDVEGARLGPSGHPADREREPESAGARA
jgi:RND superfamily putative drug exporter